MTLFDRDRTPVVPAEVGAAIALQARVALREAARVAEIGDAASGLIAGELRLGVIPTVSPYLLPSVLQEVALRHPIARAGDRGTGDRRPARRPPPRHPGRRHRRLLRPFAAPAPSRGVRLVQRRVRHRQPKVEVVIAALLRVLPAELRPPDVA